MINNEFCVFFPSYSDTLGMVEGRPGRGRSSGFPVLEALGKESSSLSGGYFLLTAHTSIPIHTWPVPAVLDSVAPGCIKVSTGAT